MHLAGHEGNAGLWEGKAALHVVVDQVFAATGSDQVDVGSLGIDCTVGMGVEEVCRERGVQSGAIRGEGGGHPGIIGGVKPSQARIVGCPGEGPREQGNAEGNEKRFHDGKILKVRRSWL